MGRRALVLALVLARGVALVPALVQELGLRLVQGPKLVMRLISQTPPSWQTICTSSWLPR